MVAIIPRSEWGARHEDGGGPAPVPFTEWWLHHSVTIAPDLVPPFDDEHRAMRTLEDIGEQRFGRGISYTWPIMPNGRVYEGHSVDRLGAHTGGRNSAARAICLVGNYDVAEVTAAQIESAAQLMVQEYRAGRAKRYTLNGGHQQLKATSCPGRYGMAAIPLINARAEALMAGASPQEDDMYGPDEKAFVEARLPQIVSQNAGILNALNTPEVGVLALLGKVLALQASQRPDVDEKVLAQQVIAGLAPMVAAAVGAEAGLTEEKVREITEQVVRGVFADAAQAG